MSPFSAILVPLDGSHIALRSLGCTTWLASRLGAQLFLLNVGEPLPEGEALQRLGVPEKHRSRVALYQMPGEAGEGIVTAVERYGIDLIVMTAHGESADTKVPDPRKVIGHVTRQVIEDTHVPVLLLPPAYDESLPWRSVLVPICGEAATDESLTLALRLAQALDLTVTIAHVAASAHSGSGGESGAGYYDEVHHEYPQMLNEFVARACALCSGEERRRISGFHLCQGDVAQELSQLIDRGHMSLLVVGWHGQFMSGHAQVLKTLIWQARCAVLLVKPRRQGVFRLKVGEALS